MTTEKKNAEIAKMIGLIPCKPPYKNAFVVDINKTHNPSFFYDLMEGEDWFVYPMFDSDANWQFEVIEWMEKQGYLLNLTVDYIGYNEYKDRIPSYWIDIIYYPLDEMGKTVNDLQPITIYDQEDYLNNRKEAIFEALYLMSKYLKEKK